MRGTPHRVVDSVATGILNGARNVVDGFGSAVKGAGKTFMSALDIPFSQLTGKEGPHRIIDRAVDGASDASQNFVDNGFFGSIEKVGEGLMNALDHPNEQTGIPPDLGEGKIQIFKK